MQPSVVGLAEAAKVAGVSESTIRRRRDELQALGAVQTAKGWQIPIPALIELGLMSRTTAPDELAPPDTSHEMPVEDVMTGTALSEMEALRAALAAAEQRAAVAEAVAQERERIIEAQAQTLRMLEAPRHPVTTPATIGPDPAVTPVSTEPLASPEVQSSGTPQRRKWWSFLT